MIEPKEKESAYRKLLAGIKLSEVLCFKYRRTVGKDNTVQLERRIIHIKPGPGNRSYARARVTIHEGMDGSLEVYLQGKKIVLQLKDGGRIVGLAGEEWHG